MKLELTRNADNKVVGYKMIKEEHDDLETFEIVRDMYFWSLNEKVLVYNGRKSDENDYTTELKFVTKEYRDIERKSTNSHI